MGVRMLRLPLTIVSVLVLAGCAGEAPATTIKTSIAPAPDPTVSADLGSIAGRAVDDEQRPVPGVEVSIVGTNVTALTDGEGRFTFNELAPGTVNVILAKLGYESVTKRIEVVAGETTEVTIGLIPILVPVARVEQFVGNGFIQFMASGPSVGAGASLDGMGYIPPGKETFDYVAGKSAVSVVSTGTWDRSAPGTASWMYLGITVSDQKASKTGKTTLTVPLGNLTVQKDEKFRVIFGPAVGCFVSTTNPTDCTNDSQNRLAQVVIQQKTTVYTDIFYVDPAPDGYVAGTKA